MASIECMPIQGPFLKNNFDIKKYEIKSEKNFFGSSSGDLSKCTDTTKIFADKIEDIIGSNYEELSVLEDNINATIEMLSEKAKKCQECAHECNGVEYIYLTGLTELLDSLDGVQRALLKMKDELESNFYMLKERKKIHLLNLTNRNINKLLGIREKIDLMDDITNDTRLYIEISKKYNLYNRAFLVSFITGLILSIISFSRTLFIIPVGITILSLIALLGFYMDRAITLKRFFSDRTVSEEFIEV
ncbi:hypothetical protein [Wukongibacter sp. M2B1]|uniref:hypothetical protein n=1 Tax=Wukongibacter sp. M2B1 TaxID=3088895 RepID=UPI003D7926D2